VYKITSWVVLLAMAGFSVGALESHVRGQDFRANLCVFATIVLLGTFFRMTIRKEFQKIIGEMFSRDWSDTF